MHVKYQLNRDKRVKYHSYVAGVCYIITSTLYIDRSLPDYVINVVGKNIKYVIVVILSPQSYNLVGPM